MMNSRVLFKSNLLSVENRIHCIMVRMNKAKSKIGVMILEAHLMGRRKSSASTVGVGDPLTFPQPI